MTYIIRDTLRVYSVNQAGQSLKHDNDFRKPTLHIMETALTDYNSHPRIYLNVYWITIFLITPSIKMF